MSASPSGLKALLGAVGLGSIPSGGVVFTANTVFVSLVAGVGITVLSVFSPARKAGKVSPIAAMQATTIGSTGYGSKERVFVGFGLLAAGVGALFVGLFADVGSRVSFVGLGALLVFFSISVLGRTVALPLSRLIGAPLLRLRGLTGALARENAMRNPKRTAATASALMIGVGLVGFITIFVASAKASFNDTIDRAFTGDFVVDSGGGMMGGVDHGLAQRIAELPQVAAATAVRQGVAEVNGTVQFLAAADPKTAFDIVDVQPLQGSTTNLGANDIAVYTDVAKEKNLHIGSMVPVVFKDTGAKQLRVSLIYGENQPAGNYLLGMSAYEANFANRLDYAVYVKKAADVDTSGHAGGYRIGVPGLPRHQGDGPDAAEGGAGETAGPDAVPGLRAAGVGDRHRPARHR